MVKSNYIFNKNNIKCILNWCSVVISRAAINRCNCWRRVTHNKLTTQHLWCIAQADCSGMFSEDSCNTRGDNVMSSIAGYDAICLLWGFLLCCVTWHGMRVMRWQVYVFFNTASPDGWVVWGVVLFTRWWLLVDHCVLRSWDRILVRPVKGLISRAGMVSICPLLWQWDVKLQQTKPYFNTSCNPSAMLPSRGDPGVRYCRPRHFPTAAWSNLVWIRYTKVAEKLSLPLESVPYTVTVRVDY